MRIVYLDQPPYLPESWRDRFAALGDFEVFTDLPDPDTAIHRLNNADLAIVDSTPLPASVLRHVNRLRYLTITATSHHKVDLDAARTAGITVAHCPTYSRQAVAEHTFALLLGLVRHLPAADAVARQGVRALHEPFLSRELRGLTLGLLGTGRIATAVARIATGFDMTVIGTNRSGQPAKQIQLVPLEHLLRHSDVLSLHMPLNHDTHGFLNAARLSLMRPSAVVINTCRGDLIDQPALTHLLTTGTLAGAALNDLTEHGAAELRALNNVILTPGTAWYTTTAREANLHEMHDNLTSYLAGNPINVLTRAINQGLCK